MSVIPRAIVGVAWSALRGWTQLAVGAASFAVVASRLAPAEIGAYGVVALLVGMVEATTAAPLGEGLLQRRGLEAAQVDATFWVGLAATAVGFVVLAAGAPALARAFAAPQVAWLLPWAGLALTMSSASGVAAALLTRELRFDVTARAGLVSGLVSGLVLIGLVFSGAGVAGLVGADLVGRAVRLGLLWHAAGYRPGRPRLLGAILPLMRFNLVTIATYWIGHADRAAPRLLAGFILGPASLGYLMLAQRLLDMVGQLVLAPIGSVTMASAARLQHDPEQLRRLVRALYRLAAVVGYPAFLGLVVLVPALASLLGPDWTQAILTTQILLLVGLRTTTGSFNLAILRGVGDNAGPLLLLGLGLGLNLVLVPLGARFGAEGVAVAMLARALLTWPVGCRLLTRATGMSARDQLAPGLRSMAAAVGMAVLTAGWMHALSGWPVVLRLVGGVGFGAVAYAALLAAGSPAAARAIAAAARCLLRGERGLAMGELRSGFGV